MNRSTFTAGIVTFTVTLPANFVRAQALLGNEWHPTYRYRIERVEEHGGFTLFISTYTVNPRRPDAPGRFVYTGVVHPRLGTVRLTARSAFPATATRVRVADRVLRAVFAGNADKVAAAGWGVEVQVEKELAGRF